MYYFSRVIQKAAATNKYHIPIFTMKLKFTFISLMLTVTMTAAAAPVQYRVGADGAMLMPPPSGTADDIVSDPQGERYENAIRSDISLRNMMGMPEVQNGEALIGDYVVSDDGTIWIKPISTYPNAQGYLRIDKQADGTYVAHTPQVFYDQDNYDGTHILAWATRFVLKTTPDGAVYYDAEENPDGTLNTDMIFTFEGGVLRQADQRVSDQGLPMEMLAMTDPNGAWAIYGSGCITMKALPADMKPVALPADMEEHEVVFGYKTLDYATGDLIFNNQKYKYVTSPSDPDAVYLNVPSSWLSDRWIRGTVGADNSWTFEKQYLGTYVAANMHIWFTPAIFEVGKTEQNGMTGYVMTFSQSDKLVFSYDEEKVSYFSADNDLFEVNASPSSSDYLVYSFAVPSIHGFPDDVEDPAAPTFTNFIPYNPDYKFGMMSFMLPNYDIDGNFMDTEKMYYRVFVNYDEKTPFVLTPEEYQSLTEDMTDVPYNFNDASFITCYNMNHNLNFFRSDIDIWGIQSVYRNGDVEKTSSVVWNVPAAIEDIAADEAAAPAVWYDLNGRRVDNPSKGFYIRKTGNKVEKVVL